MLLCHQQETFAGAASWHFSIPEKSLLQAPSLVLKCFAEYIHNLQSNQMLKEPNSLFCCNSDLGAVEDSLKGTGRRHVVHHSSLRHNQVYVQCPHLPNPFSKRLGIQIHTLPG